MTLSGLVTVVFKGFIAGRSRDRVRDLHRCLTISCRNVNQLFIVTTSAKRCDEWPPSRASSGHRAAASAGRLWGVPGRARRNLRARQNGPGCSRPDGLRGKGVRSEAGPVGALSTRRPSGLPEPPPRLFAASAARATSSARAIKSSIAASRACWSPQAAASSTM